VVPVKREEYRSPKKEGIFTRPLANIGVVSLKMLLGEKSPVLSPDIESGRWPLKTRYERSGTTLKSHFSIMHRPSPVSLDSPIINPDQQVLLEK
jgi:hypothetical protein